jgi:ubiquinone/menaquinone biosynthesis C-methylase UbiE
MDFGEANLRFAVDALGLVAGIEAPRAIDLGTGTAQIPALMLERRLDLEVVGIDLAESMLALARRRVLAANVASRCELVRMDAKAVPLDGGFDLVMSNSTAHHIPEPAAMFAEIARLVRPGGAVIVRDLFRPSNRRDALATVERVAPHDSPRQKKLLFDSLCAALTVDEVRALCARVGLDGLRIEIVSDRHWTAERAARRPLG